MQLDWHVMYEHTSMRSQQSKYVSLAETNANGGDPVAMEFLARRFFDGKGVGQSFQQSYYWSTIALKNGVAYLTSLNQFAVQQLSEEEKICVEQDLRVWSAQSPDTNNICTPPNA
jgi:TPR repeat protein